MARRPPASWLWLLLSLGVLLGVASATLSPAPAEESKGTTATVADQEASESLQVPVTATSLASMLTTTPRQLNYDTSTTPTSHLKLTTKSELTTIQGRYLYKDEATDYRQAAYVTEESSYRPGTTATYSTPIITAAPSSSFSHRGRIAHAEQKGTTTEAYWGDRKQYYDITPATKSVQSRKAHVLFDTQGHRSKYRVSGARTSYEIPRASAIPKGTGANQKTTTLPSVAYPKPSPTSTGKSHSKAAAARTPLPVTQAKKKGSVPHSRSLLTPANRFRPRTSSRTARPKATFQQNQEAGRGYEPSQSDTNVQQPYLVDNKETQTKSKVSRFHPEEHPKRSNYKTERAPHGQQLNTQESYAQEQHSSSHAYSGASQKQPSGNGRPLYKFKTPHSVRYMNFGTVNVDSPPPQGTHFRVETGGNGHPNPLSDTRSSDFQSGAHTGVQHNVPHNPPSQSTPLASHDDFADKGTYKPYAEQEQPQQGPVGTALGDGSSYETAHKTDYKKASYQPHGAERGGGGPKYVPAEHLKEMYGVHINHGDTRPQHPLPPAVSEGNHDVSRNPVVHQQAHSLPPAHPTSLAPHQKVTEASYSQPIPPPFRPLPATQRPQQQGENHQRNPHFNPAVSNSFPTTAPAGRFENHHPISQGPLQIPIPLSQAPPAPQDGRVLLVEISNARQVEAQHQQFPGQPNNPTHHAAAGPVPQTLYQQPPGGPVIQQQPFQHLHGQHNQGFRIPVLTVPSSGYGSQPQAHPLVNFRQAVPQTQQPFLFGQPGPLASLLHGQQFFIPDNQAFQKIITQGPLPFELKVQPLYDNSRGPSSKDHVKAGQSTRNTNEIGNHQQSGPAGAHRGQTAAVNLLVDAARKALLSAGNFANQEVLVVDVGQNGQLPQNILQPVRQASGQGIEEVNPKSAFNGPPQKNQALGAFAHPTNVKVNDRLNIQLSGMVVPHPGHLDKHNIVPGDNAKIRFNEPLNLHIPIGELPPRPAVNVRIRGPDGRISQVLVPLHDISKLQGEPGLKVGFKKGPELQPQAFQGSRGFHDIPAPDLSQRDSQLFGGSSHRPAFEGLPSGSFEAPGQSLSFVEAPRFQIAELPFFNRDSLAGAGIIPVAA